MKKPYTVGKGKVPADQAGDYTVVYPASNGAPMMFLQSCELVRGGFVVGLMTPDVSKAVVWDYADAYKIFMAIKRDHPEAVLARVA